MFAGQARCLAAFLFIFPCRVAENVHQASAVGADDALGTGGLERFNFVLLLHFWFFGTVMIDSSTSQILSPVPGVESSYQRRSAVYRSNPAFEATCAKSRVGASSSRS